MNSYIKKTTIIAPEKASVTGEAMLSRLLPTVQSEVFFFSKRRHFPLPFLSRCVIGRVGKIPQLFSESVTLVYGAVEFFDWRSHG